MEVKTAIPMSLGLNKVGQGKKIEKQQRMDKIRQDERLINEAHLHTIFAAENPEGEIL